MIKGRHYPSSHLICTIIMFQFSYKGINLLTIQYMKLQFTVSYLINYFCIVFAHFWCLKHISTKIEISVLVVRVLNILQIFTGSQYF